jgi:hypothetical protein
MASGAHAQVTVVNGHKPEQRAERIPELNLPPEGAARTQRLNLNPVPG